jgi:hypothetical protein
MGKNPYSVNTLQTNGLGVFGADAGGVRAIIKHCVFSDHSGWILFLTSCLVI